LVEHTLAHRLLDVGFSGVEPTWSREMVVQQKLVDIDKVGPKGTQQDAAVFTYYKAVTQLILL